jgi:hypothetical protein
MHLRHDLLGLSWVRSVLPGPNNGQHDHTTTVLDIYVTHAWIVGRES